MNEEDAHLAAENNTAMTLTSQLVLAVVTIALGSLVGPVVFSGIIENYKDDDSIKLTQLETYFIPAREAADHCLSLQNKLYLDYPLEAARHRLFIDGMRRLQGDIKGKNTHEYERILMSLQDENLEKQKETKALEAEAQSCRQKVFFKLEALSIVTGTFKEFSLAASKRADELNKIDAYRREMIQSSLEGSEEIDGMGLIYDAVTASSPDGLAQMVSKHEELLAIVESYGKIMAKVGEKIHSVEMEFFGEVREVSANNIDRRFRENFLEWAL